MNPAARARKRDKEKAPKTAESETLRRAVAARNAAVRVWVNLDLKRARPRCAICGEEIRKLDVQEGSVSYVQNARRQNTFFCPTCCKGGRP